MPTSIYVVRTHLSSGSLLSQCCQAKELPTYKDNDFINDGQKIYMDENNKKLFLEKLRKDVEVGIEGHPGSGGTLS